MSSKMKYIIGGTITYAVAVYGSYQYVMAGKAPQQGNGDNLSFDPKNFQLKDSERLTSFSKHAKSYDDEIGMDEFFMGVNLLRRWHLRKASGRVLEIGCGTGRNFDYYGDSVKEISAVDAVEAMAKIAKTKSSSDKRVSVSVMNAHELKFPALSFDTVVDTFGLCSYDDPIAVLQEMKRVCKKDGRILLIEHGRGHYNWINNILDNGACQHANNWGCIWNKDILAIVQKAGLKVESVSRFHFGTTYLVELSTK